MKPKIQPAGIAHAGVLSHLHEVSFSDHWDQAAMTRLLSMPGAVALMACPAEPPQSTPFGFILARTAGGEGEILTLAVSPENRRLGIGLDLVQGVLDRANDLNLDAVLLEVAADNNGAIILYEKAGFLPVGRRKDYYKLGRDAAVDALVLRRDIS